MRNRSFLHDILLYPPRTPKHIYRRWKFFREWDQMKVKHFDDVLAAAADLRRQLNEYESK